MDGPLRAETWLETAGADGPRELEVLRRVRIRNRAEHIWARSTRVRQVDLSPAGRWHPSAERFSRLPQHGAAAPEGAAGRHPADAVGADRAGVSVREDRGDRQRPDAAACRRATRRADHRRRARARRGRPARPADAGRGLAGQRRRTIHAPGRSASGAARPELLRRRPHHHRRARGAIAS